jgi:hypothetical protein
MSDLKELRKEARLKAEFLPGPLKSFTVLLAGGAEKVVKTADASPGGFGFLAVGDPELFIVGTRLTLYPLGRDNPVHGKIVHVADTMWGLRVGVCLIETATFKKWQDQVQALMASKNPVSSLNEGAQVNLGED